MNDIHTRDTPPGEHEAPGTHEVPSAEGGGPGRRLRQTRETQRLTREDVARQLHLDVRLVAALEDDDHQSMPAPIYVSGYLRSYARLLKLPEDEILAAFDGDTRQPDLLPNIAIKPTSRGRDALVRLVTYGLVLGLVALLLLWWLGVGKPRNVPPPTGTSAMSTSPAPSPAGKPAGASGAPAVTPSPQVSAPAPPVAPAALAAVPAGKAGANATGTQAPAAGAAKPAPEQHLSLHYTADSWTEVQDATGRQLVYRLIKAGETLELSGVAPFDVVLGYAPGVAIKYNGQPFDKGHANSKKVAHFVVGKAAASTPKAAATGGDG